MYAKLWRRYPTFSRIRWRCLFFDVMHFGVHRSAFIVRRSVVWRSVVWNWAFRRSVGESLYGTVPTSPILLYGEFIFSNDPRCLELTEESQTRLPIPFHKGLLNFFPSYLPRNVLFLIKRISTSSVRCYPTDTVPYFAIVVQGVRFDGTLHGGSRAHILVVYPCPQTRENYWLLLEINLFFTLPTCA